ncbi:MAG TPA: hypothetical protein PK147_08050 [Saprospiraceae bacterium]|nr:glyoxalase [Lewinellaceae bacterium]HPK09512.1 hypothetical protein [Saprospiraceae bacterium]HPQ21788.1 hypothetical protein [Saprospiraceae bacterium]
MIKLDPIIAVKDVTLSSIWYQRVFGCTRIHGGEEFSVLVGKDKDVLLCLHKWGEHDHPTMRDPSISSANGLILYFKTDRMDEIRQVLIEMNYPVEKELMLNTNSNKREFSLRDPDGYYLTITEYHNYEG